MKNLSEYINEAMSVDGFMKANRSYSPVIATKDIVYMAIDEYKKRLKNKPGPYGTTIKQFEKFNMIDSAKGNIIIPKGTELNCSGRYMERYDGRHVTFYYFSLTNDKSNKVLIPVESYYAEDFLKGLKLNKKK